MSSYSASRRVLFEAQGSLAAAALPSLAAVPPPATFERLATAANQASKAMLLSIPPFPAAAALPSLAAVPSPATFERLATAANQAGKAMLLSIPPFPAAAALPSLAAVPPPATFERLTTAANQAGKAMLLSIPPFPALARASLINFPVLPTSPGLLPNQEWADVPVSAPPPFRQPPPRRRGRPPDSSIISAELIEEAYRDLFRERKRRPTKIEVADKLGVGRSTVYRALREEGLQWPPLRSD